MKEGSYVVCINNTNLDKSMLAYFDRLPCTGRGRYYKVRRIMPNLEIKNGPDGIALEEIRGKWKLLETYNKKIVYTEIHFRMNRFIEIKPYKYGSDASNQQKDKP